MRNIIRGIIVCCSLLLLWQIIVTLSGVPAFILPSPVDVFFALGKYRILIAAQAGTTIIEIISGFILGILFGSLAGLTVASLRPLRYWFLPMLIISQAIPTFAIAPLLVIWLGYGMASKIVTAILMIFFPVASTFYDGLRNTNTGWLDLAKTMNANTWRILLHIRIPAALPSLAGGIRIAAVIAPVGAIIGEWVGASQGLGYLMLNANARMQIDLMFAVLMVIIIMALALYFSVDTLLRKLVWWQQ